MSAYRARPGERRFTIEEYERLCEDDGYRTELVRGRLVREPLPGAGHGWVGGSIHFVIARFVREHGLGRVLINDSGFVLCEEPPTVRGPDVAFIAAGRISPEGLPAGYWRGAPDLSVEVVSPSNRPAWIREKVADYLGAGTRLVWIVDPRRRQVTVHRPGADLRILTEHDALDGADVLPGFRITIAELLAE